MLEYAEKLTTEPFNIQESEIEKLKMNGFVDKDILEINQVVSYLNYINRTADGLGVELEGEEEDISKM
ncbi:hypothetical protein MWH28_12620 [Natroniella sulfidigena]|uniref:hypothetical protein n=1 Tax=Natroniella sulfidigena TaxID=723921 RepID=UPI00200B1F32|nr:hypothetical protein [Natroniella sulfidigena]MCK8818201.1 hypothetical protein [Natroniella sulfidigena]